VAVDPPLALYDFDFLGGCRKPLLCVVGDADPYCRAPALASLRARLEPQARIAVLPRAGHLLTGHLGQLRDEVSRFARLWLGS